MTNVCNEMTVLKYLDKHATDKPGETYLVDRKSGEDISYSFEEVHRTVEAVASSLVELYPNEPCNISILAGNRAHWTMCDLGV